MYFLSGGGAECRFHYGGATFHEISRVDIYKSIYLLNFSMMYMPAYNAIQTLVFKRTDDALFIIGDKLNHIFDFEFDIGGQGEIWLYAKPTPDYP